MTDAIAIYSQTNSPRLKYVLDWLLKERLHTGYKIICNEQEIASGCFVIAYGKPLPAQAHPNSITIPGAGMIWQMGTEQQEPAIGAWGELPVIFAMPGSGCTLPFDFFSAIFFLLSRHEEYYPFMPDKHGRYPATASVLYKHGWLQRPLLDEWCADFRKQLQAAMGVPAEAGTFLYQPTYDVDMAYSHLHKGVGRIAGAYIRALVKLDLGQISERTQVLKNKQKDPFDSFRWLRQLHKEYDCKPIYFILCALKTTKFDKNIHPEHPAMMRVIKNIIKEGMVGIHPSYFAVLPDVVQKEKKKLEQIVGRGVHISRQHYIRITTPDTYRMLLKNDITDDYSMGYGTHLGFRAGTGNSFLWYDVLQDCVTTLRIHPFCFMDTTAHYELKLPASEAFAQLNAMSDLCAKTGSALVTIFHNFSLGTSTEWKGWRQAYEHFLHEKCKVLLPETDG